MSSLSVSAANQSGFQQLSSVMAKRNAEQAEQMAKTLRKQADAAQTLADKYEEQAQTLNSKADKAKVNSNEASLRLNLSNSFQQVASQLENTISTATVKQTGYTTQETGTTSAASENRQSIGSNLDTVA